MADKLKLLPENSGDDGDRRGRPFTPGRFSGGVLQVTGVCFVGGKLVSSSRIMRTASSSRNSGEFERGIPSSDIQPIPAWTPRYGSAVDLGYQVTVVRDPTS